MYHTAAKSKRSTPPLLQWGPTVLGKVVHDCPLSVTMIAQASEGSSCIMHLPAQYECMPSGAEKEDGLSGGSHTGYTWNDEKTHGAGWGGGRGVKKRRRRRWKEQMLRQTRQREREQQRRRRGLAGLPVPPVSWDYLLLQSTVAQQKQREQQNYTLLPAQPFPHWLLHPPNGLYGHN